MKERKLVVIDAYSLLYKCFYGVRPMHTLKGMPTNTVFGFVNIIINIVKDYEPDYLFAAFDKGPKTFRNDLFEEYKAGRDRMPEDLDVQVPYVRRILESLNIKSLTMDGYEADDIIGSVRRMADGKGIRSEILTGDRDSFQLVTDRTNVLYSKRGLSNVEVIDEDYIMENYGLVPSQMIDLKALMGDSSDNIPGVKGVGQKTGLKLIKEYGSLDGVYENIENIKGKLKEKLVNGKEDAYLSRKLGKIVDTLDVDIDLDNPADIDFSNRDFISVLEELELNSIIEKVGQEKTSDASKMKEVTYKRVPSELGEEELVEKLSGKEIFAYYEAEDDSLVSLALGDDSKSFIVDENREEVLYKLYRKDSEIISHDIKSLYRTFLKKGMDDISFCFDTYIAGYILNPTDRRYAVENLSAKYLNREISIKDRKPVQLSLIQGLEENEDDLRVLIEKLDAVRNLYPLFEKKIKEEDMELLYTDIELKLSYVLAKMEMRGITVDVEEMENLGEYYDEKTAALERDIRDALGVEESFNINSTKQLGHVLFEKLKLPVIKKTKTGYSTSAEVLEKLIGFHPAIEMILELRKITKLNSTYVKGFIPLIDRTDSRIHSTFNQTVTATGRLSSSNPNLQNIPVRTKEGRVFRKFFVSSAPDRVLVDADYSQIELRVLAHISEDEKFIESFKRGEDIHRRTASEVFSVPMDEVTEEMRSRAKAVNFGIIYGISGFGLSQDIGISRNQAQSYIDTYLDKYPGVRKYMTDIVEYARENGYVKTMFNRRRYIEEIRSRSFTQRSFGERTALNTPIQGSAADIMKLAMINVENRLEKEYPEAKLVLQVHDELIVDCPESVKDEVKAIVKDEMENVMDSYGEMKCPLKADIGIGRSWYDAK